MNKDVRKQMINLLSNDVSNWSRAELEQYTYDKFMDLLSSLTDRELMDYYNKWENGKENKDGN